MKQNKTIIGSCIDKAIYAYVQKIAQNLGISTSEYVRRLIINDLEKRSVLLNTNLNEGA